MDKELNKLTKRVHTAAELADHLDESLPGHSKDTQPRYRGNASSTPPGHSAEEMKKYRPPLKRASTVKEGARKWTGKPPPKDKVRRASPDRGRNHKKAPPSLPKRGEPGGLDDPNRKDLSGAGCRWYLKHLAEGKSPEEAKKLASERKRGPAQRPPLQRAQDPERQTKQVRGISRDTPPEVSHKYSRVQIGSRTARVAQKPAPKRRDVSPPPVPVDYSAIRVVKAAILPADYPLRILTKEELTDLEEKVAAKISLGWTSMIRMEGIHFRPGYLVIDCWDEDTVDWLHHIIESVSRDMSIELMIRLGEDIPKSKIVTIYLPRCGDNDQETILAMLGNQNPVNPKSWKISSFERNEKGGRLLRAMLDPSEQELVKKEGHQLRFRFGRVQVSGLKTTDTDPKDNPAEMEVEQGPQESAAVAVTQPKTEDPPSDHDISEADRDREEDLLLQEPEEVEMDAEISTTPGNNG